jgi:hypothetical protein
LRGDGRIAWPLVGVFVAIHAIALSNALRHDPRVGYDAENHLKYVETLSVFRLPSPEDTAEFYSPPAPYLAPALARALGLTSGSAARFGLILNVLYSVGLTCYLMKICERARPGADDLKLASLGLIGILPVYYRTFAFIRGEPLLAAAAVFVAHEAIALFIDGDRRPMRTIRLGLGLGLAILSRQFGLLLVPAVGALAVAQAVRRPQERAFHLKRAAAALALAAVAGGWFYAHLGLRHVSAGAFSRTVVRDTSLSNNPLEFYVDLGLDKFFTDPVRNAFPNRLIPTFYSDVWGDYWCYFLIYGKDIRRGKFISGYDLGEILEKKPWPGWLETNRDSMAAYLGRVNLVSLAPSAVLACGLALGFASAIRSAMAGGDGRTRLLAFLFVIVACTAAAFVWYLAAYPSPQKGRGIKPTYVLQIFPFLCILAGEALVRLKQWSLRAWRLALAALSLCAAHNLPVLFTRTTL